MFRYEKADFPSEVEMKRTIGRVSLIFIFLVPLASHYSQGQEEGSLGDLPTDRRIGFGARSYDSWLPLAMEPVLVWNTFMGAPSGSDRGWKVAADSIGNVYVAGHSRYTWGTPVNAHTGSTDAFVVKLNSSGERQWNTFLGGIGIDFAYGVALDGERNVYVAGRVTSSWGTPINPSAGGNEAFVAKLNSNGELMWHTFMGSVSIDFGHSIAVDESGNVYVSGESWETWGTPVNPHAGGKDAFVAKLDNSGVRLWHTFLGSSEFDFGRDITVDGSGNVYVSGECKGTWGVPIDPYAGGQDAFVAKLDSHGELQWHTFLGDGGWDYGMGIDLDGDGNVYVSGWGGSWGSPVNPHSGGLPDAFVAKLDNGGVLQWHTFMGSVGNDYGGGIAVDKNGNVYASGYSSNTWGSPADPHSDGINFDAFAVILDSYGVRLWNTFMGSDAPGDFGNGIVVDGNAYMYVAGVSQKTWGSPIDAHSGEGSEDGFTVKFDVFDLAGGVFADGFESGNTSVWSSTIP